jgi:GDPmannose 4,6-dehydratase
MWLMLQQPEPDDYVVATGASHSVREFLDEVFGCLELNWREFVEFDPRYLRPTEVDLLEGDSSKARARLGWAPKVGFKDLVRMMIDHDLELARSEQTLKHAGHKVFHRGVAST